MCITFQSDLFLRKSHRQNVDETKKRYDGFKICSTIVRLTTRFLINKICLTLLKHVGCDELLVQVGMSTSRYKQIWTIVELVCEKFCLQDLVMFNVCCDSFMMLLRYRLLARISPLPGEL